MNMNEQNDKTKPPVIRIQNYAELAALVDEPVDCHFEIEGQSGPKLVAVPCKRLSEDMRDHIAEILRQATPPVKRDRTGKEEYNREDPGYVAACEKNEKVARAVTIYWGCPAIAALKPGLVQDEEIYQFIRPLLSDTVKELIALTIQKGGLNLAQRANFYSTPGSES